MNSKGKMIFTGILMLAVVFFVIPNMSPLRKINDKGYEKVVTTYLDGVYKDYDYTKIYDELIPQSAKDWYEEKSEKTIDELRQADQEKVDELKESYDEKYDSWSITYTINNSRDAKVKELFLPYYFCAVQMGDTIVTERYVSVTITEEKTMNGEKISRSEDAMFSVIKIGDECYLYGINGEFFNIFF